VGLYAQNQGFKEHPADNGTCYINSRLLLWGHYAYYGITGNEHRLRRGRWEVIRLWRKWLNQRSQRMRRRWERFVRLLEHYPLPRVRIVHTTVGT